MLAEGQQVELKIEKPASGGRMIARHLGQVVLVRGAIPGERVTAWIERAEKRLAYAVTREVIESSPDRRASDGDALCGGALYAHIAYDRQLAIKAEVVGDAFARIGKHLVDTPIDVMESPEEGYRMRARFHMHGARAGFYREGTHQLCDAAATRQLLPQTTATVDTIARALDRLAARAAGSIAIAENIAGDERAAHLELAARVQLPREALEQLIAETGLNGISVRGAPAGVVAIGSPFVSDPVSSVTGNRGATGDLQRHAESFFQGNRYLLPALVTAVVEAVPDGDVLDLYAGVGLFSVALASTREVHVTAVEGDRASGTDLVHNAGAYPSRLEAVVARVEDYVGRRPGREAATTIVNPPRTGLSREAIDSVIRHGSRRIVYVSCDPPTLARDARRFLDSGYAIDKIRAFDLFPNTPHVETLAVFVKR